MTLVWAVPVVAALAAAVIVVARSRDVEHHVAGLGLEVVRLGRLRRPLHEVRHALAAVDVRVGRFADRHGTPDQRPAGLESQSDPSRGTDGPPAGAKSEGL